MRPDRFPANRANPATIPKIPQTTDKAIIAVYTIWKSAINVKGSGTRLSSAPNIKAAVPL